MARTPRAARTLIRQVRDGLNRKPDSKAGVETGQPDPNSEDGLGVYRTIIFDKVASKWLSDHLDASDPRIDYVDEVKGQAIVHFVAASSADDDSEFDLSGTDEDES